MKKRILRNIIVISAIFIVTFSIMLITNYFQVRDSSPLQTEVVETLKQLNDQNAGNVKLQEQIRLLDLQARKAYFTSTKSLEFGIYILIGVFLILIASIRMLYSNYKNIPDKEIDPIDEWAIKSKSRKYIIGVIFTLSGVALIFGLLSSPILKGDSNNEETKIADANSQTNNSSESASQETTEANKTNIIVENTSDDTLISNELANVSEELDKPEKEATEVVQDKEQISDEKSTSTPEKVATEAPKPTNASFNSFRGNNSDGKSSATNIPTSWNLESGENIAWKIDVPKKGYNSPVINGNKVYFTGADESARELYCYDLNTGKQLWKLNASNIPGSPSQMPKTTEDTGLAASTVATNGNQVCAIFATGDIICSDTNGKQLWAKNLGVPDNHYGYASSLLIYGNEVIVQYDNQTAPKLIALNLQNGNELWSKARSEKVTWSSPTMAYNNSAAQLILMGNPAIKSYNPNNGDDIWSVNFLSGEVGASACSSNGVIYGASEYAKMVAINSADGSIIWESNDYLPEVASPVATKDNVYIATSYGVFAAYNTADGTLRKDHDLGVEFYSSPIIVDNKIYLFSNSGKMHIFSTDNDFKLISSFETGEQTFATPAFTDGKIVVRSQNSIYCVTAN